jgi:uncharacterized protein YkwD
MRARSGERTVGSLVAGSRLALCAAALVTVSQASAAAQAPADDSLRQMEAQVLAFTNEVREANGLGPVTRAPELDAAARSHALDLATRGILGPLGSDGSDPARQAQIAGYVADQPGAESVASRFTQPVDVLDQWVTSNADRGNFLSSGTTDVGIGVVFQPGSPDGWYWTMLFSHRRGTAAALAPLIPSDAMRQTEEERVLYLVNLLRENYGLLPLARNTLLDGAAWRESLDQATHDLFDDFGSDSSTPGERAVAAGYNWAAIGENIAAGRQSALETVGQCMQRLDERANILDPDYQEIGIALVSNRHSRYGCYWTLVFGAPVTNP